MNSRKLFSRFALSGVVVSVLLAHGVGCRKSEMSTGVHEASSHGKHGEHAGSESRIVIVDKDKITPGQMNALRFHIEKNRQEVVKDFDTLHEKLVHLIVVSKELDHFDHLHPTVDTDGHMTANVTFPTGGDYLLFADYQPKNGSPTVGKAQLSIPGRKKNAPVLKPNDTPTVHVDGLRSEVTTSMQPSESTIKFQLLDDANQPIADLQPYLGSMGHLVILSADGKQYVHAHPLEHSGKDTDGIVSFAAHFPSPGIYKMWGQFQRQDKITTVPFVVEFNSANGAHAGQ